MNLMLLGATILALGAMIWTKAATAPVVILGIAQAIFLCHWLVVRRREARRWRHLLHSLSPLLLTALLAVSFRVYPSILFPGLLLTALALGLLVWSGLRMLVRRRGNVPISTKAIVGLILSLLALDFVVSMILMFAAGLGHSAREGMLVPWKLLLLFLWIVVLPVSIVMLCNRYRFASEAGRKRVRLLSATVCGVILLATLFALARVGYWPPILYAARNRHPNLERWLITSGVDVNVRDPYDGWSPLTFAARWNDVEMVRLLLEHGARDLSEIDEDWPALIESSIHGHLDVVKLLLPREPNSERARDMALCFAARHGHADLVEYLLNSGANIESLGQLRRTALQEACEAGQVQVVRVLLRRQAQIPQLQFCGNALIRAAWEQDPAMISLLLDHGVDVNFCSSDWKQTALMSAAAKGGPATVQFLLDRNADPNLKNVQSKTALDIASEMGHTAVVELLRRADATNSTDE